MLNIAQNDNLSSYIRGEEQERPWGKYKVIDVGTEANGEEFCQKEITVNPGHILSLQSHAHRREEWTVQSGTLFVVLENKRFTLEAGQSINIPLGSIHCMANGGNGPCIVHEKQIGLCSEEDIVRYVDAYGRATMTLDTRSQASAEVYISVKNEITKNLHI